MKNEADEGPGCDHDKTPAGLSCDHRDREDQHVRITPGGYLPHEAVDRSPHVNMEAEAADELALLEAIENIEGQDNGQ